jgi:hypothetical protein
MKKIKNNKNEKMINYSIKLKHQDRKGLFTN